ncbi:hypothetical protein ABT336_12805 [Micromonospora sp. NPDC000207]|uniref:hypothetical protein n=1 Tax=Micromonospora sp. NPDC000207 TaxID=3154246 RepID=UPI003329FF4B
MTRKSGSAGTKSYQEKYAEFVAARDAGEIVYSETEGFTTWSADAQAIRRDLNNWVANGIPARLTAECPEFEKALIDFCPRLAEANIAQAGKDARFANLLRAYLRKELTGKERKRATERLSLINRDMVGAMGDGSSRSSGSTRTYGRDYPSARTTVGGFSIFNSGGIGRMACRRDPVGSSRPRRPGSPGWLP